MPKMVFFLAQTHHSSARKRTQNPNQIWTKQMKLFTRNCTSTRDILKQSNNHKSQHIIHQRRIFSRDRSNNFILEDFKKHSATHAYLQQTPELINRK